MKNNLKSTIRKKPSNRLCWIILRPILNRAWLYFHPVGCVGAAGWPVNRLFLTSGLIPTTGVHWPGRHTDSIQDISPNCWRRGKQLQNKKTVQTSKQGSNDGFLKWVKPRLLFLHNSPNCSIAPSPLPAPEIQWMLTVRIGSLLKLPAAAPN